MMKSSQMSSSSMQVKQQSSSSSSAAYQQQQQTLTWVLQSVFSVVLFFLLPHTVSKWDFLSKNTKILIVYIISFLFIYSTAAWLYLWQLFVYIQQLVSVTFHYQLFVYVFESCRVTFQLFIYIISCLSISLTAVWLHLTDVCLHLTAVFYINKQLKCKHTAVKT